MLDSSINLLEELNSISKIHWLDRDDIDQIMLDFGRRIAATLRIERVSVWLFNHTKTSIVSMGEFDMRTREFDKNNVLDTYRYPGYFSALRENRIILVEDVKTNKITKELYTDYFSLYSIYSLMDIPIRVSGELTGVICFEKTGVKKIFTEQEQSFAFSTSLVLSSNLEARYRRAAQHKLVLAMEEKDILIKEINHRVKNNFSILISLMRISKLSGKTTDPIVIFEEYEQRIMSMLKIHDLLYQTGNYSSVKLSDYMKALLTEFKGSQIEIANSIEAKINDSDFMMPTKSAIHMGLIISEIFLNSLKYALPGNKSYQMLFEINQNHDFVSIKIGDNGPGFDFRENVKKSTMGLPIIKDLAEGMNLIAIYPTVDSNIYEFSISRNQSALN
jgi:two-component sensor histidine kinase